MVFSPDGRWVLSASFDKSVKLWDGVKGTFLATFRGHVGPVYQVGQYTRKATHMGLSHVGQHIGCSTCTDM